MTKKPSCLAARRTGALLPNLPCQPDRHGRCWAEADVADGVVGSAVVNRPAGQQAGEDLEPLVEHPAPHPRVRLVPERAELPHPVVAQPQAEHEPATREHRQARGLPGQNLRAAPRQRGHHRTEQQLLGPHRDRRAADPHVGDGGDSLAVLQVVPDEEAVPAGRLGGGSQVPDHPGVGQGIERGDEQPATCSHGLIMPT